MLRQNHATTVGLNSNILPNIYTYYFYDLFAFFYVFGPIKPYLFIITSEDTFRDSIIFIGLAIMIKILLSSFVILTTISLSGCFTFESPTYKVELGHDATYKMGGGEPKEAKAGEAISSDGEPLLVEAPGKVGLLIYPAIDGEGLYKLNLRDQKEWSGEALGQELNRSVSEILLQVNEAQVKLSENQAQAALDTVKQVQKDHPGVTYLYFIEASCLYVLGKEQEAKAALAAGLQDFPEHKAGRNLYQSLGGKLGPIEQGAGNN